MLETNTNIAAFEWKPTNTKYNLAATYTGYELNSLWCDEEPEFELPVSLCWASHDCSVRLSGPKISTPKAFTDNNVSP